MTTKISNQDIENYYNQNQILYNIFYSKGTDGLHYGFWGENTKDHPESLRNTTRFVAKCLKINKNDKVLDAGCGIGGSSIYIAKKYGADVVGITLSDIQLKIARKKALKLGLDNKAKFLIQDFTKTSFNDGCFSKIFGVESICHSEKKIDFLNEAHRVLKKGGIITISDGFQIRPNLSEKENKIYQKWLKGWAVPNLATVDGFHNDLKKTGFRKIKYYDKFNEIKKTRDRIYRLGIFGYPLTWMLSKIGIFSKNMHDNTLSMLCQKKVFSDVNNIATYGVFIAEK